MCLRQLLLCRVALGKPFYQFSAVKMAHSPPGHHSVIGRPSSEGLSFAEYVVYRGEQVSWCSFGLRRCKAQFKRRILVASISNEILAEKCWQKLHLIAEVNSLLKSRTVWIEFLSCFSPTCQTSEFIESVENLWIQVGLKYARETKKEAKVRQNCSYLRLSLLLNLLGL